jgi:phosphoserine phosphatase RsbU/P
VVPEIEKQTVMVVDDSLLARKIITKMLEPLDVNVVTASGGGEAVELFKKHDLAIILMDVIMEDMDGFQAAEQIRALELPNSRVPIIFVTATLTDAENVFKGYEAGAVDYLLKPVESKPLCAKVGVFCELHAQRKLIQSKSDELEKYIEEINVLRGLVPICANCKNVRDDDGYWLTIEQYFTERSDAEFSHSICPVCVDVLYPNRGLKSSKDENQLNKET